jgi:hypothetical protein
VGAADAIYAPLAPIDTGSGDIKAFASRLASIVAHAYVYHVFPQGIEAIRRVLSEAEEAVKSGEGVEEARRILEKAGVAFEPRPAPERHRWSTMTVSATARPSRPWPSCAPCSTANTGV